MHKITKEVRQKNEVCKGLELLKDHFNYKQKNIKNKLDTLNYTVSMPSLSNIKNGTRDYGMGLLNRAAKGIQEIVKLELDMVFDINTLDYIPQNTEGWTPYVVPEYHTEKTEIPAFQVHAEGRVSIQQKASFIADARKEVIEVGVRLNTFAASFISQNESAYKNHIITLLKRGVNIKCFLLDPDSEEAKIYLADRALEQPLEKDAIDEMKRIIQRLKALSHDFKSRHYPGSFEVYLYRHIPFSQFQIVDGAMEGGKMMVAPYLYGISRANCPVLEFTRTDQPLLFGKFWESAQSLVKHAKNVA